MNRPLTYCPNPPENEHCALHTFSAKERDSETGLSYFGARYYSSDLSTWLSVDPMSDKYPSLSPYVYCADNPVKLVDPNGEEIGDPPLKRILNIGNRSNTFRRLFRKAGLTEKNMSKIIIFGDQSSTNPYTKKITLRDANSDMENVIALTHEMTNRINSKRLQKNDRNVRVGVISYKEYSENAVRIETEGVANQIIVASEIDYSFPNNELMNDLKSQYKEGVINRRQLLNQIKESDIFIDESGRNAKEYYYEQGKNIRDSQIQREKQSMGSFKHIVSFFLVFLFMHNSMRAVAQSPIIRNDAIRFTMTFTSYSVLDSVYSPMKYHILIENQPGQIILDHYAQMDTSLIFSLLDDKNYDWATNLILYSLYDVNAHILYAFDIKTREDWIGYFQDKDIVMWHNFFKRRKEALR